MKLNPPLSVVGLCFFLIMGISWQVGAYDEDDLEKLKSTGDCSGCDLSGVFLQGADLTDTSKTSTKTRRCQTPTCLNRRTGGP